MINWKQAIVCAALPLALLSCAPATERAPSAETTQDKSISAEDIIWAKELAIFEGRGQGDISFYINTASDAYLGWPPVLDQPTNLDTLKASADMSGALKGEVSKLTKKGFTRNGNTALMYFLNNRTRLGDGFAPEGERDINQFYENVHVWNLEDGEWKLIGGFARTVDAERN